MVTEEDTLLEPGKPKLVWYQDAAKARQEVEAGELDGYVAFPENFSSRLMGGDNTELEVVANAEAVNAKAALNSLAQSISSRIGAHQVVINASISLFIENGLITGDGEEMNQVVQQIMAKTFSGTEEEGSFVEFITENVGEAEAENPANFVVPGYLVMFVFFAAALAAESIVRERQNNTLERLLSHSVTREAILGGIFTGTAMRGLIQIVLFWAVGILVFQIDMGLAPWAVVILSALMVIMSSAFAVMLATLAKTQRSAGSLGVITALVLAPLGGCWWPLFLYPSWLQSMAKVTPHAWATTGFNKLLLYGADFNSVIPEIVALAGFAIIFGLIGTLRFRTSAA
jgi:ABC-2 type transport system permease protein